MEKIYAKHLLTITDEKIVLQRMRNDLINPNSPTGHIEISHPDCRNPREATSRFYDELYEYVCFIEVCQNKSVVIPLIKITNSASEYNTRCDRMPYITKELTKSEFDICKKILGGI